MRVVFELLRVQQWYKNLVVFLALFYTRNVFNVPLLSKSILAFFALCAASSSYYIINDVRDRARDRSHPEKKLRPIASGKVGVGLAFAASFVLLGVSLCLGYFVGGLFVFFAALLFASGAAYALWLRDIAFVDLQSIAANFVIRAVGGAVAINVPASAWLVSTIYFVALLLAVAKRKGDLMLLGGRAAEYRRVYRVYSMKVLDSLLDIVTGVLIVNYMLYTFTAYDSSLLMLTMPFAIIMLTRYLHLVEEGHVIARKTHYFFRDGQLTATFVLWALSSYVILMFIQHRG